MLSSGRKKIVIILSSIVIALLVVMPGVFHLNLLEHNTLIVNSSKAYVNYTWSENFVSTNSSSNPSMGPVNSSLVISEPGHPTSYVNTSVWGSTYFLIGLNSTQFFLFVSVTGYFAPNLEPTSLNLTQRGRVSAPYSHHQIYAVMDPQMATLNNLSANLNDQRLSYYSGVNLSQPGVIADKSNLTLSFPADFLNVSSGRNGGFHFSLERMPVYVSISGIEPGSPFYMDFRTVLAGLSVSVGTSTNIAVNDISPST